MGHGQSYSLNKFVNRQSYIASGQYSFQTFLRHPCLDNFASFKRIQIIMSEHKSKVTWAQAFREIIWPRRKLVFVGLILIAVSRAASLVLPWESKVLIDEIIPDKDFDQLKTLIWVVALAIVVQSITSFMLTILLAIQISNEVINHFV